MQDHVWTTADYVVALGTAGIVVAGFLVFLACCALDARSIGGDAR